MCRYSTSRLNDAGRVLVLTCYKHSTMSIRQVADLLSVSTASICTWLKDTKLTSAIRDRNNTYHHNRGRNRTRERQAAATADAAASVIVTPPPPSIIDNPSKVVPNNLLPSRRAAKRTRNQANRLLTRMNQQTVAPLCPSLTLPCASQEALQQQSVCVASFIQLASSALKKAQTSGQVVRRKADTNRPRLGVLFTFNRDRDLAIQAVTHAVDSIAELTKRLPHEVQVERVAVVTHNNDMPLSRTDLMARSLALRRSIRNIIAFSHASAISIKRVRGKRMKLDLRARTLVINKVVRDEYLDAQDMKVHVQEKFPHLPNIARLSTSTLYRILAGARITHKKTHTRDRKTDPDKLAAFWENVNQLPLNELVSYDECHVHNKMTRNRGWSKVGTKAFSNPRHKKQSERYTLMLAVSAERVVSWQLVDKSATSVRFRQFLTDQLKPAMDANGHLSTVILDNAVTHRTDIVQDAWVRDGGMRPFLFNAPYHPDTNPVEMVFAIVKRYLRKVRPKTKAEMERQIGLVLETQVTPVKLTNIFKHSLKR
jgi:transposase